jgi:uncharacterized membrane protein
MVQVHLEAPLNIMNLNLTENERERSLLAKMLGCHGIPERCLVIHGKRMTICARCTGMLIGYLIAIIIIPLILFWKLNIAIFLIGILLVLPMAVDGLTQLTGKRVSNNPLRLTTGILGGIGQIMLICLVMLSIVRLGIYIYNQIN